MKKLIPLILLFIGIGAGVGAGMFLRPDTSTIDVGTVLPEDGVNNEDAMPTESKADPADSSEDRQSSEFLKFENQFVIPIVKEEKITSLVVMALSLELAAGSSDDVYLREPKLRDSFLQVLFDHANIGGFEGNFTEAEKLSRLRVALKEIARRDISDEVVKDVLIVEIARQDY